MKNLRSFFYWYSCHQELVRQGVVQKVNRKISSYKTTTTFCCFTKFLLLHYSFQSTCVTNIAVRDATGLARELRQPDKERHTWYPFLFVLFFSPELATHAKCSPSTFSRCSFSIRAPYVNWEGPNIDFLRYCFLFFQCLFYAVCGIPNKSSTHVCSSDPETLRKGPCFDYSNEQSFSNSTSTLPSTHPGGVHVGFLLAHYRPLLRIF